MGKKHEQDARLFQQLYDQVKLLVALGIPNQFGEIKQNLDAANSALEPVKKHLKIQTKPTSFAFSFAVIAVVYSYEFAKANKPHFAEIVDIIDEFSINVESSPQMTHADKSELTTITGNETKNEAIFRHLRNSLAHGRYDCSSDVLNADIILKDYNGKKDTFEASCTTVDIVTFAEKLLIATHKLLVSKI